MEVYLFLYCAGSCQAQGTWWVWLHQLYCMAGKWRVGCHGNSGREGGGSEGV